MKKFLLLILCLVSSLVASAESGKCGDNLFWNLEKGTLTIFGTGKMTNFSATSAPWFSKRSTISSVIISEGVTSIGDYAFWLCYRLISVTIPNSVTSIGEWAFKDCSDLTSVTIPNSVTSIGDEAFKYCSSLKSVNISCKDMEDFGKYVERPDIEAIFHTSELSGKEHNIYIAGELQTSINIPNSVKSIGDYAFSGCSGLESVTIGNSVTSIGGNKIFYGCSGLESVTIGNSVTSIGRGVFSDCINVKKTYICRRMHKSATNILDKYYLRRHP